MLTLFGLKKAELVDDVRNAKNWLSMRLMALATTITAVWGALNLTDQQALLDAMPWLEPALAVSSVVSILAAMRGRVIKQPGL